MFETLVGIGTDILALDIDLDPAAAVLQGRETRLAHYALEHHPAGDTYFMAMGSQFLRGVGGVPGQQ